MKTTYLNPLMLNLGSLRSSLPAKLDLTIRQLVNRAIQALPRQTRGHYLIASCVVLVAGLTALLAGAVMQNQLFALVGAFGIIVAGAFCLMVYPAKVEALIVSTQHQADVLARNHATACARCVAEFRTVQHDKIQAIIATAVGAGATLDEIRAESAVLLEAARAQATALREKRETAAAESSRRDTEFRRMREHQTAFYRLAKARLLPWFVRRDARDVLSALAKLHETAAEVTEIDAALAAFAVFDNALSTFGQPPSVILPAASRRLVEPPWRGISLPMPDEIERNAIELTRTKLGDVRTCVLQAVARQQSSADAVVGAARALFAEQTPWPTKLSAYTAGLNGQLPTLLEPLIASGSEWLPTNRAPGRKRHRKIFLLTDDVAHSPLHSALKERLPDAAGVVGIENPSAELMLITEEHNLSLSEIPEAQACLASFRAASAERQESLVLTVKETREITQYSPDHGILPQDAEQLLAVALTLGVIVRGKDQRYRMAKQIFAQGFAGAAEALRQDQRLAETVESAVTGLITSTGVAQVIERLTAARNTPTMFVPTEAEGEFAAGLDSAIADLQRA